MIGFANFTQANRARTQAEARAVLSFVRA